MKIVDLLLLIAAISLTVAGFLEAPALGCLALSVASCGAWYLLGDG